MELGSDTYFPISRHPVKGGVRMSKETVPMTVDEAAKFLRNAAEMTARHSQNWDNFENICRDVVDSAFRAAGPATADGEEG